MQKNENMSKPKILVRNITSLSEARYCAGMMVDFISFEFNPESEYYLSPDKLKEIRSWLSGIKVLGTYKSGNFDSIPFIIDENKLDGFIFESDHMDGFPVTGVIIKILEIEKNGSLPENMEEFDYILLKGEFENQENLKILETPFLVGYDFDNVRKNIKNNSGFGFLASKEVQTGINQYDDLMDALDYIEDNF